MKSFSFNDWLTEGGNSGLRSFALGKSYERISWVYSCVHTIATTASRAPLAFYEGTEQNRETRIVDPNHPVIQLFTPPNPPEIISLRDLLKRSFTHLGISGGAYWVFEKKKGKWANVMLKPALKPVKSGGNSGKLIGWVEQTAQGLIPYTVEQVLPILNYNPGDPYTGMPPLAAARLSIEAEFNIAGWNTSFFKSGMKNPLLLQSKGTMTPAQKRDIKKEIINYYSGTEGGQSALLLQGNIEVKDMNISPKDVDFVQGKKFNREEICAIYGVPPALVGIFEYANYSNVKEQRKIFWENTLLPIMDSILDVLQINILNTQFPGVTAAWDVSALLATNSDPAIIAAAAEKYWAMGYTPSMISNILKVPELDVDESEMRDTTPVVVAPALPADKPKDDKPKDDKPKAHAIINIDQKSLGTTDLGQWLNHYGSINEVEVNTLIASTKSVVKDYFKKIKLLQSKGVTINKAKWLNTWDDTVGMNLRQVGGKGILSALTCMKTVMNKGKKSSVHSAKDYLEIHQISDLESYLQELVVHSQLIPSSVIGSDIDTASDDTLDKLASTLTLSIHENLKYKTYKLVGVSHLVWASGCEKHKSLHGNEANVTMDLFDNGSKFPHDPNAKQGEFSNCRCTTVPIIFPVLEGKSSRL